MRTVIPVLVFLLTTAIAFGQDLNFKKKIFTVDGQPLITMAHCKAPAGEGQTCMVKSAITNDPLFTTYVYNAGEGGFVVDIKFVDFREECRVDNMLYKKLFAEMYNMNVFREDGTIDEDRARKFSRAYDIVKDRKIIIVNE